MSDQHDERDLKSAIRELAAALERGLDDHPTREELKDFTAGDLPESERDRIEEHLALCRDCARLASEEAAVEPELGSLTAKELDTEWERFQKAAGISPKPSRVRLLAAMLLVGVLGLVSGWVLHREIRQPRTDTQIVRLQPVDDDSMRSARPQDTIRRDGEFLVLFDLLASKSYPADADYRLEVRTANGREIWNLEGVRPVTAGTFSLNISRRALPAGQYQITLFGPQGERIARYLLRIDPESP